MVRADKYLSTCTTGFKKWGSAHDGVPPETQNDHFKDVSDLFQCSGQKKGFWNTASHAKEIP
jgi:hypothetical protein